jgi:hypothetical protein
MPELGGRFSTNEKIQNNALSFIFVTVFKGKNENLQAIFLAREDILRRQRWAGKCQVTFFS